MANIVVSATALAYSGALTILKQFINYAGRDLNNKYIIFVPEKIKLPEFGNVNLIEVKKQNYCKRVLWDAYLFKRYLRKHSIEYDVVLSLQNTSLNVSGRKLIYLHQPLPFYDIFIPWTNRTNFKLWCYKYFYYYFITLHIDDDTEFLVQTEWMKHLFCQKASFPIEKVHVVKPEMNFVSKISTDIDKNDDYFSLIYPATPMFYKNHALILESLSILKKNYGVENIKLHVTFNKSSNRQFESNVKRLNVGTNISYHGHLSHSDLLKLYLASNIMVFPSYIETYGLPLLEAASLGIYILASDLPYAREVLDGYNGVEFIDYQSADDWARAIYEIYTNNSKIEQTTPFNFDNSCSWIKLSNLY